MRLLNRVLHAFVVDVTVSGEPRLRLMLEESVVQYVIVNLDLTHLRLDSLAHPLLQCLAAIARLLPDLVDASRLNVVWQFERLLLKSTLVLQVSPLFIPVVRYGHCIADLLQFN